MGLQCLWFVLISLAHFFLTKVSSVSWLLLANLGICSWKVAPNGPHLFGVVCLFGVFWIRLLNHAWQENVTFYVATCAIVIQQVSVLSSIVPSSSVLCNKHHFTDLKCSQVSSSLILLCLIKTTSSSHWTDNRLLNQSNKKLTVLLLVFSTSVHVSFFLLFLLYIILFCLHPISLPLSLLILHTSWNFLARSLALTAD